MSKKLIFVYNANSGLGNAVSDSVHKFVSPETYPCQLCDLTHGYFGEKKAWQTFLKTVSYPVEFYHKDEISNLDIQILELPCVLLIKDNIIERSLSGEQRKHIDSLNTLIKKISEQINL